MNTDTSRMVKHAFSNHFCVVYCATPRPPPQRRSGLFLGSERRGGGDGKAGRGGGWMHPLCKLAARARLLAGGPHGFAATCLNTTRRGRWRLNPLHLSIRNGSPTHPPPPSDPALPVPIVRCLLPKTLGAVANPSARFPLVRWARAMAFCGSDSTQASITCAALQVFHTRIDQILGRPRSDTLLARLMTNEQHRMHPTQNYGHTLSRVPTCFPCRDFAW